MHIKKAYKYKINNTTYVAASLPDGAEVLDEMNILYAKEGYTLIKKSDNEDVSTSVWLKEGDSQENYEEREIVDEYTLQLIEEGVL